MELFFPNRQAQRFCSRACKEAAHEQRRDRSNRSYLRRAVGIDGEGHDRKYFLIAASDANGETWSWWNAKGLTSRQCFDFLLDVVPKDAVKWGFGFKYDVNMMIGDLPEPALERLHNKGEVRWREYFVQWIPGKRFYVARHRMENGRHTKKILASAEIWDMYSWQTTSFVVYLKKYRLAPEEEIQRIAVMKELRPDFKPEDREQITQYCLNECRYLAKGADDLMALIQQQGLHINRYHSPAAISKAKMRNHGVQQCMPQGGHNPDAIRVFEKARFGGRNEVTMVGPVEGPIWQYDHRSSYPFFMTQLPCWRHGQWRNVANDEPIESTSILEVQWCNTKGLWGPLPFKLIRPETGKHIGSLKWPANGHSWYWGSEVMGVQHLADFTIHKHLKWFQTCDERPFAYMASDYEQRRILKELADPSEYVLKISLNGSYGSTAEKQRRNQRRTPPMQDFAWAGMITAGTRGVIGSLLTDDAVMVATDGLFTRKPLSLPIGTALGEWDETMWDAAFIVGPGVYFLQRDGEWTVSKTRGYPALSFGIDQVLQEWETNGRQGKFIIERQSFIGLGAALHRRHTVSLIGEWRKFIPTNTLRSFDLLPRRQWCSEDQWDGTSRPPTFEEVKSQLKSDAKKAAAIRAILKCHDLTPRFRLQKLQELLGITERGDLFKEETM
jgi:hypothetical protein